MNVRRGISPARKSDFLRLRPSSLIGINNKQTVVDHGASTCSRRGSPKSWRNDRKEYAKSISNPAHPMLLEPKSTDPATTGIRRVRGCPCFSLCLLKCLLFWHLNLLRGVGKLDPRRIQSSALRASPDLAISHPEAPRATSGAI